ncbi:MAG: hypothetical protein ACTS3F_15180 [Phycisphaerales bacterium]
MAIVCGALGAATPGVGAQLQEENVLLVWNSESSTSQAVRDAYIARRPGVLEFDLNDPSILVGTINRTAYVDKFRVPIREFINGTNTGVDLSEQIMVIALTRGVPVRISGTDEFTPQSTFASLDSTLALLQQDLEVGGTISLPFRYAGVMVNPYYTRVNEPITGFSRSLIKFPRGFSVQSASGLPYWFVNVFTPGDMYMVCRLDAAPTSQTTGLEETLALIERTRRLVVVREHVQALLDEFPPASGQFDDDGFPPPFPIADDFGVAAASLAANGIATLHDQTSDFITGPELPDPDRALLVLGSYGENHDIGGEDPPGGGVYLQTYAPHPAGVAITYESFNGNSIVNGLPRGGQEQMLNWIPRGASFAIATINEPFTFAVPKLRFFVRNMYEFNMSFAEAAWSSIPPTVWQHVALGDPLARVSVYDLEELDFDDSGAVSAEDLYAWHASPTDLNQDGEPGDLYDAEALRNAVRFGETRGDVTGG